MTGTDLVSVIIPAYNAADTIDETLCSVRSQTHGNLEIFVIDDGSTDDTVAVAQRHAAEDPRVQVIRQPNAGVAAARNTGWKRASSDLIAFIDADDLWAPAKIERQLEALHEGGDKVGLVYCWYAVIDEKSRVTASGNRSEFAGDVLDEILHGNFIGNGSSALVRREALERAGGFEPGLRAAGAQGCEDFLFYCRVAEFFHFNIVPEFLIGYRYLPNNMSSDMARMLRSWILVTNEMILRHPAKRSILTDGVRIYAVWLIHRALYFRQRRQIPRILNLMIRSYPLVGFIIIIGDLPRVAVGLARITLGKLKPKVAPLTLSNQEPSRFPIGKLR